MNISAGPPVFTSSASFSVAENQCRWGRSQQQTRTGFGNLRDNGRVDQAKFTIHAATGVLVFSGSPDFENPWITEQIIFITLQ